MFVEQATIWGGDKCKQQKLLLFYTSRGTRRCPGWPIVKPDGWCYFLI